MTEWRVRLRGHEFDLAELSQRLRSPDLDVIEEDDSYYLTSQCFDSMTDSGGVLQRARELLGRANGAMRIEYSGYEPVEAEGLVQRIRRDKKWDQSIHVSGPIKMRGRSRLRATASVVKPGGSTETSADPVGSVQSWLGIAGSDVKVDRALRVLGSRKLTMAELYKALEIVEEDVGGERKLKAIGWAPRAEIERFKQTVNSIQALGYDARHGREFQAPKNPMTLREGHSLIAGILKRWRQTKPG